MAANDTMWVRFREEKRHRWDYSTKPGTRVPLPSIQRMYLGVQVTRPARWERHRGAKSEKISDDSMREQGYVQLQRSFAGDVIVRADLSDGDDVQVQLPPEYNSAIVRMYGAALAKAICEGLLLINGPVIRGPFRLVELGGTMTLTLNS